MARMKLQGYHIVKRCRNGFLDKGRVLHEGRAGFRLKRRCIHNVYTLNVKFAYKRGQTCTGNSHFAQFLCFARMRSTEKHKQNGGVHKISLPSTLYSGHTAC